MSSDDLMKNRGKLTIGYLADFGFIFVSKKVSVAYVNEKSTYQKSPAVFMKKIATLNEKITILSILRKYIF